MPQTETPARPDIVHVGMHKTATTWLQRRLFPTARNFRMVPEPEIIDTLLNTDAMSFDAESARKRLRGDGSDPRPLLISQEELSGNPHAGGLFGCFTREAAWRIADTLPGAQVVLVLREQVDMIATAYRQYVHDGGTYGPRRYLEAGRRRGGAFRTGYKIPGFSFAHFDYEARVRLYESAFGAENLHVYLYEDLRRDGDGFVARLVSDLGLELDDALADTSRRDNVSLGRRLMPLARGLNHFTLKNVAHKRCIVDIIPSHRVVRAALTPFNALAGGPAGPEHLFDAETIASMRSRYAPGNTRLAEARGLDLKARGYAVE